MLELEDSKWKALKGGYKIAYDPRSALKKLENGTAVEEAWEELWSELHHQGDLGEASYAAVPTLVKIHENAHSLDWNLYALVATIELERHRRSNPTIPEWLEGSYKSALNALTRLGVQDLDKADDETTVRSILGFLALAKGELKLGALICTLDQSEIEEYLDEQLAWSEHYR